MFKIPLLKGEALVLGAALGFWGFDAPQMELPELAWPGLLAILGGSTTVVTLLLSLPSLAQRPLLARRTLQAFRVFSFLLLGAALTVLLSAQPGFSNFLLPASAAGVALGTQLADVIYQLRFRPQHAAASLDNPDRLPTHRWRADS